MSLTEKYLDQRFQVVDVKYPPLPFFHTCEAKYLQNILDSKSLEPRICPVYDEELLYLFYGKPAYKSGETSNSPLTFMMPICFIINYEAVSDIHRLLAFDSGAFSMYQGHLHESMTRREFELTPSKESFNKMVNYFYGDNNSYFNCTPKQILDHDSIHFQLEGYHSLITSKKLDDVDDRKTSFEIQLNKSIALNSSTIEAIILPQSLKDSDIVKQIITNELGITMIPITNYAVNSRFYYVHMLQKAKEFLISKKVLSDV